MKPKHILILDDEREICFLLTALLTQMGYETECAHNLDDGIYKLSNSAPFDLVFLDLNLPDGLGYHIVPNIKEQNREAKVVMISAHDSMLKKIKSETDEVDEFLTKPFSRENITHILQELDM
ncbi:MAG: response regulator [Cyclobacteriaceae bacterium]